MPEPTYPLMASWIEWVVGTASKVEFPATTVLNEATGLEFSTLEWSRKLGTAVQTIFKRDALFFRDYIVSSLKLWAVPVLEQNNVVPGEVPNASYISDISDISETKELPGN